MHVKYDRKKKIEGLDCARFHTSLRVLVILVCIKEKFVCCIMIVRARMTVLVVCTKDGGAGRKRGGE